jgi:lysozyme
MRITSLWQRAFIVALLALMLVVVMPAKEASASGCGAPVYYQVRCGDTLYSIAHRYGVTVVQMVAWNHIANPNLIYAGQWLVIYPGCGGGHGFWYTVRYGDTLYSLACRFHTTVWAIAHANGIWNPNYIWAGQHLWIP